LVTGLHDGSLEIAHPVLLVKIRQSVSSETDRRAASLEIVRLGKILVTVRRDVTRQIAPRNGSGLQDLLAETLVTAPLVVISAIVRHGKNLVIVRERADPHEDRNAKAASAAPSAKVDSAAALAESMDSTGAPLAKVAIAVVLSAKAASVAVHAVKVASNRDHRERVDSRVGQNAPVVLENQVAPSAKAGSVVALVAKAADLPARVDRSGPADLAAAQREMVAHAAASKSGD
jgi:hypothetical protein